MAVVASMIVYGHGRHGSLQSTAVAFGAGDRRMRHGRPERGTMLRYGPRTCCGVNTLSTNVEVLESCGVHEECKDACWVRTGGVTCG